MSKLDKLLESVRESEAYQQVKAKYDELDGQSKLYVNLGALAAVVLLVFLSVLIGMAKVNGLKSEIEGREELIGYLQRSADSIKQLKAQASASNVDTTSPLPAFVENVIQRAGLDRGKAEIGAEHPGAEEKESIEMLIDVKLNQINLRQLSQVMFQMTEMGAARSLNIKDLLVDTKGDPSGFMDATVTVAAHKAK